MIPRVKQDIMRVGEAHILDARGLFGFELPAKRVRILPLELLQRISRTNKFRHSED